ncbi:nuclear transport factor 2 family protein [Embleya scabrispora]|uniref:nuclear transport factor 2 family protein n=1 Tax=Embleya scabrispora TaxID=159449 RepID=UPI00036F1377|nr:nuclear transport factor 2 family protein [Embleya scabrispora]MYS81516.1 nuclear transport factor 2 family protein [Streptomyces sp. SID5474]
MSEIEAIVEKYVATWAEPDAEIRRKNIAELWAENCVYSNTATVYRGRDGIEEAVTEAYENFVPKGFGFRVARVDATQEAVRYQWEVVPAAGGEPTMTGTQVVIFDADGRMVRDHQFIDKVQADQAD